MKRFSIALNVILLALLPAASFSATGKAVSLRALEAKLASGNTADIVDLGGITRITGYMVDSANKDIVLVGAADAGYPALNADDLVVAFRNTQYLYAEKKNDVISYSPPGCSIDPSPQAVLQLREISKKLFAASKVEEFRALMAEWEKVGGQPQHVKVTGIPNDTHFAKVMVEADYDMKRLENGTLDLNIPGLKNLLDMQGDQPDIPPSHDRFWFVPGECMYAEKDGLIMLTSCQIKVLTEQEMIHESGERSPSGKENPLAVQFARDLTAHLQEVAAVRPVYRQMENLFRFIGIMGLIRDRKAITSAGISLPYLTEKHSIQKVAVSRTLPGLARAKEVTLKDQGDGLQRYRVQMISGGIIMDVRPKQTPVSADGTDGRMAKTKENILAGRKSSDDLSWDFQLPE